MQPGKLTSPRKRAYVSVIIEDYPHQDFGDFDFS